jgi:hypothetical protein
VLDHAGQAPIVRDHFATEVISSPSTEVVMLRVVFGRGANRNAPLSDCWHSRAVRPMLSGMFTKNERTDFSVAIKSRGKPPNPWRWEIYRAGRSSAIAQSPEFFSTMAAANKAGKEALAALIKTLHIGTFE